MIKSIFETYKNLFRRREKTIIPLDTDFEYCPRCDANLTLQKGYDHNRPYWKCLGCGEMLINPELNADSGIVWLCDGCNTVLNNQPGFSEDCDEWSCAECGFRNKIDASELYCSDEEYQSELLNPYRGLSDEDVLELSLYEDEETVSGRNDIVIVRHKETERRYIKKILKTYDKSIYRFIKGHPINHMPQIIAVYESSNCLIIIESYVEGKTVEDILKSGPLSEKKAVYIAKEVCKILKDLHSQTTPIIHRDIKPSNIIVTPNDEVYLLDINVAKWYDPGQIEDTRYLGTQHYAAPEQVGYGFKASSAKTDIYAMGIVLNEMITGCYPKEKMVTGRIGSIIEHCISLDMEARYDAGELLKELDRLYT